STTGMPIGYMYPPLPRPMLATVSVSQASQTTDFDSTIARIFGIDGPEPSTTNLRPLTFSKGAPKACLKAFTAGPPKLTTTNSPDAALASLEPAMPTTEPNPS